jgi:hypothetical protein
MACPDAKRFSPIYPQFAPLEELVFPTEFFTVAPESTVFPKSGGSGTSAGSPGPDPGVPAVSGESGISVFFPGLKR